MGLKAKNLLTFLVTLIVSSAVALPAISAPKGPIRVLGNACFGTFQPFSKPSINITTAQLEDPMVWAQIMETISGFNSSGTRTLDKKAYVQYALRTISMMDARNQKSLTDARFVAALGLNLRISAELSRLGQSLQDSQEISKEAFEGFYSAYIYFADFTAEASTLRLLPAVNLPTLNSLMQSARFTLNLISSRGFPQAGRQIEDRFEILQVIQRLYEIGPIVPMLTTELLDNDIDLVQVRAFIRAYVRGPALPLIEGVHHEGTFIYNPSQMIDHELGYHVQNTLNGLDSAKEHQSFDFNKLLLLRALVVESAPNETLVKLAALEIGFFSPIYYKVLGMASLTIRNPETGILNWKHSGNDLRETLRGSLFATRDNWTNSPAEAGLIQAILTARTQMASMSQGNP